MSRVRHSIRARFIVALLLVGGLAWLGQTPAPVYADPSPNGGGTVTGDPPLLLGSGFQEFIFFGVGSTAGPFTFTAPTGQLVRVTVTDLGCAGDQFRVSDNSRVLGNTSAPTTNRDCSGTRFVTSCAAGLASPEFSPGSFYVAPGSHSVTVTAIQSPVWGGTGCIRADAVTLTKADCTGNGWQRYGVFKNQGDCVSFVATGGKNPPAKS